MEATDEPAIDHRRHVVVLGDPVPVDACAVGGDGQVDRRREGLPGGLTGAHGQQVEHGESLDRHVRDKPRRTWPVFRAEPATPARSLISSL